MHNHLYGLQRMVQIMRKYPVSGSSLPEKMPLFMSEIRGQWVAWFIEDYRKATVNQITTHYNQGIYQEYHLWTQITSNPEADGLQQQKTTPGAAPVS